MHIEFTLTHACPVMCIYCPQHEYINAYSSTQSTQMTSLVDYKRMLSHVDDVTNNIDFSGYTEPLVNPDWYNIFKYTVDQGYNLTLYSTLYGASIGDIDLLTSLPIQKLLIHVIARKGYINIYDYLSAQCIERGHDITFIYFTEAEEQIVKQICMSKKRIKIEKWTLHSRAGKINAGHTYIKGSVECCEERCLCNVVLPNGDVYVCCMDFKLEHKLGNLLNSPLALIHKSEALARFRANMLARKNCICNKCIYAIPQ